MKYTYSKALEKISSLEDGEDLLAAIKNQHTEISEDRKSTTQKLRKAESMLASVLDLMGVEGDKLTERTETAKAQIEKLQKSLGEKDASLKELEGVKTKLEQELSQKEKVVMINKVAALVEANPVVLEAIAKNEEFTIEGDKVMVKNGDDKPVEFSEYAEKQVAWKPFQDSLFPKSSPKIPKGKSGGGQDSGNEHSGTLKAKLSKYGARFNTK